MVQSGNLLEQVTDAIVMMTNSDARMHVTRQIALKLCDSVLGNIAPKELAYHVVREAQTPDESPLVGLDLLG